MCKESKKLFGNDEESDEHVGDMYLTIDEFDTNMCEVAEDFVNLEDRVAVLEKKLCRICETMEKLIRTLMYAYGGDDESETEN